LHPKGSYRAKFIAEQGDQAGEAAQKKPFIKIDPATRQLYEEGKMILIDKEVHWTSFDVVNCVRSALRIKKVGHAGTLDPLATGLLIICTGKFTKQINNFMSQVKEYTGTITLGAVTPTYDLESLPENHQSIEHITETDIRNASIPFIGSIQQMPPIYSAIKKAGVPLYELARRGADVELKPRSIQIQSFEITSFRLPEIDFKLVCSTGTYVRSLAHDLGQALGCGAYLSALRRTGIGDFRVEDAQCIDAFRNSLVEINIQPDSGNQNA
jgi:tRNA pseudouridine55 synthase